MPVAESFIYNSQFKYAGWGAGFPGDSAPVLNIRADLQIEDKFGSSAQMVLLACFGWSSLSMRKPSQMMLDSGGQYLPE